jgi:hypothetical protein
MKYWEHIYQKQINMTESIIKQYKTYGAFEEALKENAKQEASQQALRYNQGKLQWSLVDYDSLEGLVRVLEAGAKKYSRNNWKKGMPVTQVTESLMRHLFAFLRGEDVDPESGCRHISHVMCNTMFLEYIMREKPHFDDRYNKLMGNDDSNNNK